MWKLYWYSKKYNELEFEVHSEYDINNIDALSCDNADNIDINHESDSNDSNVFPFVRWYIPIIESEIEGFESDTGENVEDTSSQVKMTNG